MKVRTLVALGVLYVYLTPPVVHGQVSAFQAIIPFPFVVGSQTLPAGTYLVQRLGEQRTPNDVGVIVMKTSNHQVYKVIVTGPGDNHDAARAEGSRLVFTSFKGREYLNRVWIAGDAAAHQLADVPFEITAQGPASEVIVTGFRYSKGK